MLGAYLCILLRLKTSMESDNGCKKIVVDLEKNRGVLYGDVKDEICGPVNC